MNNNQIKIPFKEKLGNTVKIQKRQVFALAIEFGLGFTISLLALLGAFLQVGVTKNIRDIYRYVTISLIAVGLLATLLSIRFYKNDNIVEMKYKIIFSQKFLAYVFFVLLIVVVSIFLLSSKYYGTDDINLESNKQMFTLFRWLLFPAALLMSLICLSLLILNSVIAVKNDTKISYQTILAEEQQTQAFEASQGELQTNTANDQEPEDPNNTNNEKDAQ